MLTARIHEKRFHRLSPGSVRLVPDFRSKSDGKDEILNPSIICFQLLQTHDCFDQKRSLDLGTNLAMCESESVLSVCAQCSLLINERPDKQILEEKNILI